MGDADACAEGELDSVGTALSTTVGPGDVANSVGSSDGTSVSRLLGTEEGTTVVGRAVGVELGESVVGT